MNSLGIDAFLHELGKSGVSRIFGNPGTTELPLMDALVGDPRFEYILGLHEGPVMAMADGYAMASRSLGVVNLHASCGVGNAMGQLYNAFRQHTPLLVTAGQQDRRLLREDPILAGDLVAVTRSWTKYSSEISRVEDIGPATRHAIQAALTPPRGPVFLSLPIDVQLAPAQLDPTEPPQLNLKTRPPANAVKDAARRLAGATNPVILAGSRVCDRNAFAAVVALAERLGAPVFQESVANHGRLGFPSNHELRADLIPLWSPDVRQLLEPFDVAVVVGMDLLRQYIYFEPANPFPESLQLIHLDEDPLQLGKNASIAVGLCGDIGESLDELNQLLAVDSDFNQGAAETRRETWTNRLGAERAAVGRKIATEASQHTEGEPLPPNLVMSAIARALPDNAAVVEEAVTTTNTTLEQLAAIRSPDGYFAQRGWTLGWGVGCAIGAKLAWPDRPVVAVIGDGSFMYGAPALWTAVQHKLPIVVVLCNNGSYRILKSGARSMQLPHASKGQFLAMDLPAIDFVALAKSLGAAAHSARTPGQLTGMITAGFHGDGPTLIEVAVADEAWGGQ